MSQSKIWKITNNDSIEFRKEKNMTKWESNFKSTNSSNVSSSSGKKLESNYDVTVII